MLNELQVSLERLYDVSTPHRVEDFVVHDPNVAEVLAARAGAPPSPEQLFVAQDAEEVALALFLEPAIVERLGRDNPRNALHAGNLTDFCTALEGVSHFLYLVWNAHFERPVTAFEMELQAEVDKYILSATLLGRQRGELQPSPLWHALFSNVTFRSMLQPEVHRRYQAAHQLAAHYCRGLDLGRAANHPNLIRELRRFYRLPHPAKVRHIHMRHERA